MCMDCSKTGKANNSYTPKKMTVSKKASSPVRLSAVAKGWAGTGGAFGSPKIKVSFGRR